MPSSLIFVLLVAAWLAVLVPMVAKHRREIRRTGDGALATRVLHHGGSVVRLRRPGPAAGHRSDPDWQVHDHEEAAVDDQSSEHEAVAQEQEEHAPRRTGRGGYDPEADAVARMARYAFRQRVVVGLLIGAVLTAILALVAFPSLWWVHVVLDLALVGYLAYLRRQVRIEEDIRERRMARLGRARLGVDSKVDEEFAAVPRRLRRPGAVVLEVDDEDPAFEDLDEYPGEYALPHASGQ